MTRFFLPIYRKVCLGLVSLALLASAALAQNVTVIGPITPGDCPQFNSTTVIKDSGFNCNGFPAVPFANPSAFVGLSAVNGSASTAMRSDAAPPLSNSVQSALTGTNALPLIGTGAFGFATGTKSGNTNVFGTTTGGLTSGDCVKIDAASNFVDAGAACGTGSGGNTPFVQDFLAGTNFTPGTTTSLTLSSAPSASALLSITFDGINQNANTWSLVGAVITFNAAIPTNTQVVEARYSVAATLAGVSSIGIAGSPLSGGVTVVPGPTTGITQAGNNITIGNDLGWVSIMDAAYGAKCNAVIVSSGTISINSGATTLTVSAGSFTSADAGVGKSIWIPGAGVSGAGYSTTISTFISATQVTVAVAASTTVTAAALSQASIVVYGTDDTAAINAAIAAVPPFGTLYINPITLSFPVRGCLIKQSGATGRSLIFNNPINVRGGGNLSALITDPSMGTTIINMHALVSGQSWKGIRWEGFTLGTDTNFTPMTRYGSYGIWFDATSGGPAGFQGINIGPNLALGESTGGFYSLVLDGVGTQGNRIENNFITGGIDIAQTADSNMILNNRLLGVSTFGIHVDTPSAGNFILSGNSITLAAGVCILNGSGVIVSNNFFEEETSAVQYPHNAFLDIGCSSGQSMSSTTVSGNIILAGSSSSSTPIKIDANTGFTYLYANEIATSTARAGVTNANASTTVGPNQWITATPHCSGTTPTLWGVSAC